MTNLGGKTLATLGATVGEDPTAAHSRLAGTKPVAALPDEHTGLKSALHG